MLGAISARDAAHSWTAASLSRLSREIAVLGLLRIVPIVQASGLTTTDSGYQEAAVGTGAGTRTRTFRLEGGCSVH